MGKCREHAEQQGRDRVGPRIGRSAAMYMHVQCPCCGHRCRVLESSLGQAVTCSACAKPFRCGSIDGRSLATEPLPVPGAETHLPTASTAPAVRSTRPADEQGVNYKCPSCSKALESPARLAGQKLNCPGCGQRLQVPQPAKAWAASVASEPPPPTVILAAPPAAPMPPQSHAAVPPRKECCLECGMNVTGRSRVLTCPNCGALFCSAGCFRSHNAEAHGRRR